MKKNIFISVFVAISLALVVVSITLANCLHANKLLRAKLLNSNNIITEYENRYDNLDSVKSVTDTYGMYSARIVKPNK